MMDKSIDKDVNTAMPQKQMAYRLNGDAALREAINRLRREASELEAFLDSLPRVLTPQADAGLWSLAQRVGRF
jgi:hypothetical protein